MFGQGSCVAELAFTAHSALYALLGLVVGILVGRQLEAPPRPPAPKIRRDRDERSQASRPASVGGGSSRGGGNGGGGGGTGRGVELYVGNLPYETTDKELGRAFERFGRVLSVRMIENRRNGKPKGFGFVEMDNDAAANAAIKAMNGTDFKGRSLVVNEAKSRARQDD
ncbi:MAG: hypothetical protein K8T26_00495 [Lentisphaerae bacterium]|nr:hypothetical protein [Lentisphaerota bacterium]